MKSLGLLLVLVAVGCYAPDVPNGALKCADNGRCPKGFECAVDGTCWRIGEFVPGGDGGGNTDMPGAMADMTPQLDLTGFVPKKIGETCTQGVECESTFCADGVCCQTNCTTEACKACNLTGTEGVCTEIPGGQSPVAGHPSCGPDPVAGCKRDGKCDGAGACRMYDNTAVCKPKTCDSGTNKATAESKCDGAGTCVTPAGITCVPYLCDITTAACFTSCAGAGAGMCSPGNVCASGSCGLKPLGSPCSMGTECVAPGLCVDGVCCNAACTGQCQACDIGSGTGLGTCQTVGSGQPHGSRGACTGNGTSCGGTCNGGSATVCNYPATQCRTQSCSGSTQTNAANCSAGACPGVSTMGCGAYVCNSGGTGCLTSCSNDTNCAAATPFCNGTTCLATRPNGRACTAVGQCTSMNCVDGFCCNSACTGQCQACDVGASSGTCTTVTSGQPHGGRAACTGAGTAPCGGTCNGSSSTACGYPTASCRSQSCTGSGTITEAANCSNGSCPAPVTSSCGLYHCLNTVSCKTSCTVATQVADCTTDFCNGTVCALTCFAAGTLVQTPTGARAIETFAQGDEVLSFDATSGRTVPRSVVAVERRMARALVNIALEGAAPIVTTPEHYFWVKGSGWVRASDLTLSDRLLAPGGKLSSLVSLSSVQLPSQTGAVEVFNLVVTEFDNFFVGATPVLVHSCDYMGFSQLDRGSLPR